MEQTTVRPPSGQPRATPPEGWLARRILPRATPRTTAMAVALYAISVVALTLSDAQIAAHGPGLVKPDLRFGYDFNTVMATLTALDEAGRRAYAWNLVIDTVMPVMLAAATILVAARAAPRWLLPLSAAPATFLVLDLVENASFAWMLVRFPDVSPGLVAATSPVTMVKLASFGVALPTLVLGIVVLGARAWRGRGA